MKHMYMNVIPKPDIKNNTTNRSKNTRQEIHKNIHIYIYLLYICIHPKTNHGISQMMVLEKVYLPLNKGNILVSLELPGCTGQHHRGLYLRSASAKSPLQRGIPRGKKTPWPKKEAQWVCVNVWFLKGKRLRIIPNF